MKVDIQHAHADGLEIVVDKGDGFHAMDEFDFHMLDGVDAHKPLQQGKRDNHDRASGDGDGVISHSDGQAEARYVPQGRCGGQTGNFLLADENRTRTQKADAADDLGADASIADGDAGAFIVHIERNGICNHEAFHNGDDGSAHAYQHMRAHTGGPVFALTFNTNHTADDNGQQQT